jgi:hypothetical protein
MSINNKPRRSPRFSFYSNKASLKIFVLAGVAIFIALAGISAQAEPIIFQANFQGNAWTDASRGAFQYAADIWGGLLSANYAGETITIDAYFDTLDGGKLASTQPIRAISGTLIPNASSLYNYNNYYFPSATANHIAGTDLEDPEDPTHNEESEIKITFSPLSGTTQWWYETDNPPPPPGPGSDAYYDFATIALHEIAHGLGLVSALTQEMLYPFPIPDTEWWTGWYYDMYVFNNRPDHFDLDGNALPAGFPISVPQADRLALVTDPGYLIFGGVYAKQQNSGVFPVLYSPPLPSLGDPDAPGFVAGSSVSHLSEVYHAGDLMNPRAQLNAVNHLPSDLDLAMLKDVGWISVAPPEIPEPNSLLLLATGTGALFFASYRRNRK